MPHFGHDGMIVLNVAEKNDAAKSISQIMSQGRSNRREGFSKFNKIYEYNYNLFNCNCNMIMTSVSGHLINTEFSGGYKNWNQCMPVVLFEAQITRFVPPNFVDIKRTLEREIRKSQALIIWTDGDREGENIGFEIIEVCCQVKPNVKVYRAKFSEITARAIHNACQNLVEPDQNTNDAVEVRRELDLRIGAAFTRFQTLRLQKRFPNALAEQLISYGSCQFPTLGFVVERYKQVENFVPEAFYKIKVLHEKDNLTADFTWARGRLFNQRICSMFCRLCNLNPRAKVITVFCKPKSKWRPLPLDTVELEKLASRKLKINAKETMKIAEKLYTQGFISYPRTETNIFPKGMNLTPIVESQTGDRQWGEFASKVLTEGGPNPRQGKKTDNAHPPIHPIKYTNNLQGNEKRIYEFIVRHFLACVSKDAQGQETRVEIDIAGEKFSINGLQIISRNYLDVYCYERWNVKNIPIYNQGDIFDPDKIEMVEGETNAPPLLSEADLISLMEKYGIGTDATHAEHIETIKARSYVGVQQDGTFLPGQLGMGLVEGYDAMGFAMSKPYLRAGLEADLKCICDGSKNKDVVLAEQIRNYRDVFQQSVEQVEKLDNALSQYFGEAQHITETDLQQQEVSEPIRKCSKCNADMILRKTKEGSWLLGCMGYPNCRNGIFFPKSVINLQKSQSICSTCLPRPVHKLKFQFTRGSVPPMLGTEYVGCIGGCDDLLMGVVNVQDRRDNSNNNNSSYQRRNQTTNRAELGGGHHNAINSRNKNRTDITQNRRGGKSNRRNNRNNKSQGTRVQRGVLRENENNNVVCNCSNSATLLTVRKEGPNCGRQFYKCANTNGQCNFFLWADAPPK